MYYRLKQSGIDKNPGFGLTPSTLLVTEVKNPVATKGTINGMHRILSICGEEKTVVVDVEDYYPVPKTLLMASGVTLQMDLNFKFTHELGKHQGFKLTFDPRVEEGRTIWQITIWTKPTTHVFDLETAINRNILELLTENGFTFDGFVQPIQLTRGQYTERYNQAKAYAFN